MSVAADDQSLIAISPPEFHGCGVKWHDMVPGQARQFGITFQERIS